jgi:hypothetical protein
MTIFIIFKKGILDSFKKKEIGNMAKIRPQKKISEPARKLISYSSFYFQNFICWQKCI